MSDAVTDPQNLSLRQLFSFPFRIFFLSLAVFAVVIVPLWVAIVTGAVRVPLALPDLVWHRHEMIFGLLSAAIAGFLLTAVCVWTRTERLHGSRLLGLWLIWLAGRALLLTGSGLPELLVQGVNLSFLPLVMLDAGWRIWQARQARQLMILLVLALLWGMQVAFVLTHDAAYASGGLIMAMALSGIVGGRITPAFSAAWLRQRGGEPDRIRVLPRLDLLALASLVLLLALELVLPGLASGLAALLAAALMLARLVAWRGWLVAVEPLLWSLHLSLLWIPVSLILLAGFRLDDWPASAWSHASGLGVVASLILAVMARVALGHTGRALVLPRGMVTAFVAIQGAALLRVATAFGALDWRVGVCFSAVLWVLAFALYLLRYAAILCRPRIDGRAG